MDPVDEERPSAMRSTFMPAPAFSPCLAPTNESQQNDEERPSAIRRAFNTSTETILNLTRNPLAVEKKTEDGTMKIGNSHTSEHIKQLLRQYDVNGDDTLDIDEVTALVEHLLKEERQGRNLRWIVIGLIVFTCVLIAAMAGLTYAIVYTMKDTKVSNTFVMLDKGSGDPIRVANTDFTVTSEGLMAYRPTPLDGGSNAANIHPTASDTMRTAAYTGTTQQLHSGMDITEVVEMNFISLTNTDQSVSVSLRVNGVSKLRVDQSQYGTVMQILTDKGTITLDGDIISYDDQLAHVFTGSGFANKRRRALLQGEGTEIDGMYNRLVAIPPVEPKPFQEYKDAWDIAAETKQSAAELTKTIKDLISSGAGDREFSSMWADWKIMNGKSYPNISADTKAFNQWKLAMLPVVNVNNENNLTYWTSLNEYSDMTTIEFAETRLLKTPLDLAELQKRAENSPGHRRLVEKYEQRRKLQQFPDGFTLPYVNWTQQGKVTPVKNQGGCGSCWAYAAAAALESAYLIATEQYVSGPHDNSVIDLSEQQMISCTNGQTNVYFQSVGCDGGDPLEALSYSFLEGVTTETVMPDVAANTAITGVCDFVTIRNLGDDKLVQAGEDALYAYPFNDETEIKIAVMKQPIAIYFMVDDTFMNYKGGIYMPTTCGIATNHNMLLVGYDTRSPQPFWIIKNQWGTGWGEQGYARVAMTGDDWGPCGMYGFVAIPPLELAKSLGKGYVAAAANPFGKH